LAQAIGSTHTNSREANSHTLSAMSVRKTVSVSLPGEALDSTEPTTVGTPSLPSPVVMPWRTPQNVATTAWRHRVCPKTPGRKWHLAGAVNGGRNEATSTPKGFLTPTTNWPNQRGVEQIRSPNFFNRNHGNVEEQHDAYPIFFPLLGGTEAPQHKSTT